MTCKGRYLLLVSHPDMCRRPAHSRRYRRKIYIKEKLAVSYFTVYCNIYKCKFLRRKNIEIVLWTQNIHRAKVFISFTRHAVIK